MVTISGIGYHVSGGSIDVSGNNINVPSVNAVVTTTLGSLSAVLYPPFTGLYVSITATYLTPVPFSTSTPTTSQAPPPPSSTPTPTSTSTSTAPEATCSIQGNLDSEGVAIWTNYVTDEGVALQSALEKACGVLGVSDFGYTISTNKYTDSNGVAWQANADFRFTLGLARAAAELNCVNEAIENAGGDPNNPTCDFTPALR